MKVSVITNIPSIKVSIFHGFKIVAEKFGTSNVIPLYNSHYQDVQKDESTETTVTIDNLPKGIYEMRIYLPYHNPPNKDGGQLFDMPVVMDKTFILNDEQPEVIFSFKATFEAVLEKKPIKFA